MNQSSTVSTQLEPETIRQALNDLQAALKKRYGRNAPLLLLYGSYARGEAKGDSDIDVVFIYAKDILPGQEITSLRAILAELNLRYQALISVLPVSADQYEHSEQAFWKQVRREGVKIGSI